MDLFNVENFNIFSQIKKKKIKQISKFNYDNTDNNYLKAKKIRIICNYDFEDNFMFSYLVKIFYIFKINFEIDNIKKNYFFQYKLPVLTVEDNIFPANLIFDFIIKNFFDLKNNNVESITQIKMLNILYYEVFQNILDKEEIYYPNYIFSNNIKIKCKDFVNYILYESKNLLKLKNDTDMINNYIEFINLEIDNNKLIYILYIKIWKYLKKLNKNSYLKYFLNINDQEIKFSNKNNIFILEEQHKITETKNYRFNKFNYLAVTGFIIYYISIIDSKIIIN